MLLDDATLDAVAAGRVTLVFRRWRRPTVRSGGTLRTRIGMLDIEDVAVIDEATLTDADAGAAGFASLAALQEALHGRPRRAGRGASGGDEAAGTADRSLYRIRLRPGGPDPLVARRAEAELDAGDLEDIRRRLDRFDQRSPDGPWTTATLGAIAERPGVRAAELAASLGRERLPFKADVRKLKALGLTISLEIGYRLSPRGAAVWRAVQATAGGPVGDVSEAGSLDGAESSGRAAR